MSIRIVIALLFTSVLGCSGPSAKIVGKVTCGDKPVPGTVQFSPLGEGVNNTGPTAAVPLGADGSFAVELKSVGKHRVVVSPSDIPYPTKPGYTYPCDLTPTEVEVKQGDNSIDIPLKSLHK